MEKGGKDRKGRRSMSRDSEGVKMRTTKRCELRTGIRKWQKGKVKGEAGGIMKEKMMMTLN